MITYLLAKKHHKYILTRTIIPLYNKKWKTDITCNQIISHLDTVDKAYVMLLSYPFPLMK